MASSDYHFVTIWRLKNTPEEITEIISAARDLPHGWPAVYWELLKR